MRALTFHDFVALIGDRFGKFDVPCPLCASLYNPRKKVLRIWRETESFLGYHCARCGESGWARDGGSIARPSPEHLAAVRQEATARDAQERADSLRKAQGLWSQRQPVEAVSAAWVYVRDFRAYQGPIPPTLGALPASTKYPPALIAAFGFAIEPGFADGPEPGVLTISDDAIHGVHLIQLQVDGRDRLRTPDAKKSIGRGCTGT